LGTCCEFKKDACHELNKFADQNELTNVIQVVLVDGLAREMTQQRRQGVLKDQNSQEQHFK
jgi:hypothetical protein